MGRIPTCQWDTSPLTANSSMWDKSHMARVIKISPSAAPVAHEVYRRMVKCGLGQKALALRAGVNGTYVRDLFAAKSKNPKTDQLQKLADFFGCTVRELTDPGGAGGKQRDDEIVDPSSILPINASEFSLITMWRVLDQPSRDSIIARVAELVAEHSRRRKNNDI